MAASNEGTKNHSYRALLVCGAICAVFYAVVLWLSFDFQYGRGHADRPIIWTLFVFALATVVYIVALAVVFRCRQALQQCTNLDRRWFLTVFLFGVAFRCIMLPSNPIQEIDYYRYLWDGRVTANGYNPYRYSPQQIDKFAATAAPDSDLAALGRLSHVSPEVHTLFRRVHHRHVPTVYPPAAQVVFAASATLTPASAPMLAHVLVLKSFLFLFDIGTFLMLALLLRHLGLPMCWSLAYGWCPLVLKEISNSAHLDSIAIFCTTAAIYLIVKAVQSAGAGKGGAATVSRPLWIATAGTALLGVGVLAKSYPIILTPLFAAYLWSRFRWRCAVPMVVCFAVVCGGYLSFSRDNPQAGDNHSFTGLQTFLTQWQMNDLLFMIVHENLRYPRTQVDHVFVVVPRQWRTDWNMSLWNSGWVDRNLDPAFLITFAVMGLVLMTLAGYWALRVLLRPAPIHFLQAAFLTLIWGWLLSAAQNPWYLLWALPLMLFAKSRSWFLLTGFAFMYYLRFWLEYQNMGNGEHLRDAMTRFDFGWVWLEYMPVFVALVLEYAWRKWSQSPSDASQRPLGVSRTQNNSRSKNQQHSQHLQPTAEPRTK